MLQNLAANSFSAKEQIFHFSSIYSVRLSFTVISNKLQVVPKESLVRSSVATNTKSQIYSYLDRRLCFYIYHLVGDEITFPFRGFNHMIRERIIEFPNKVSIYPNPNF